MLLIEGMKLAQATFAAARQALGWVVEELDEFVIHQVSRVHTEALVKTLALTRAKCSLFFTSMAILAPPRYRSCSLNSRTWVAYIKVSALPC